MPRKKVVEQKKQIFELEGGVRVTVEFPVGSVRWQATHNAVSIATGDAVAVATLVPQNQQTVTPRSEPISGETNGPAHDTPEILALKARLGARNPVTGEPVKVKPFTSEDAFREMGMELEPGELTPEGLQALAAAGGGTVV